MPSRPDDSTEAVVICTRNRPDELAETLRSVAAQEGAAHRLVLVVDGSDPIPAKRTEQVLLRLRDAGLPVQYHRYSGPPAGTRQRNKGVDLLPTSVQFVHFIDDDASPQAGYFDLLTGALRQHPSLLGVGGLISLPADSSTNPRSNATLSHLLQRLFLLRANQPSRVLPSGQTTPAWPAPNPGLQPAEWLSTCASTYRRTVFSRHRFDPDVEGPSPRLEDLDFSFRVAQDGPLAVHPSAACVHRRSSQNRRRTAARVRERTVRRYWFVEKNLGHYANRLAYWWSLLGRFFVLLVSSHPDRAPALRGVLRGIEMVWTRNHPLLRRAPNDEE